MSELNTAKAAGASAPETPVVDPKVALAEAIESARRLLLANGYGVRTPNAQSAKSTVVKAEPATVKAFFEASGLTRQQLADAVGVSTSVIATVANPNGDRWSQERYERAIPLINAYKAAIGK